MSIELKRGKHLYRVRPWQCWLWRPSQWKFWWVSKRVRPSFPKTRRLIVVRREYGKFEEWWSDCRDADRRWNLRRWWQSEQCHSSLQLWLAHVASKFQSFQHKQVDYDWNAGRLRSGHLRTSRNITDEARVFELYRSQRLNQRIIVATGGICIHSLGLWIRLYWWPVINQPRRGRHQLSWYTPAGNSQWDGGRYLSTTYLPRLRLWTFRYALLKSIRRKYESASGIDPGSISCLRLDGTQEQDVIVWWCCNLKRLPQLHIWLQSAVWDTCQLVRHDCWGVSRRWGAPFKLKFTIDKSGFHSWSDTVFNRTCWLLHSFEIKQKFLKVDVSFAFKTYCTEIKQLLKSQKLQKSK